MAHENGWYVEVNSILAATRDFRWRCSQDVDASKRRENETDVLDYETRES